MLPCAERCGCRLAGLDGNDRVAHEDQRVFLETQHRRAEGDEAVASATAAAHAAMGTLSFVVVAEALSTGAPGPDHMLCWSAFIMSISVPALKSSLRVRRLWRHNGGQAGTWLSVRVDVKVLSCTPQK